MPRERCFPTICSSFVPLTLTVSATLRLFILNKATVALNMHSHILDLFQKIYPVQQEVRH